MINVLGITKLSVNNKKNREVVACGLSLADQNPTISPNIILTCIIHFDNWVLTLEALFQLLILLHWLYLGQQEKKQYLDCRKSMRFLMY